MTLLEAIDEQVFLTSEQAISMLPDGDDIHTIMQSGPAFLGADWSRKKIIEQIKSSRCELGGERCRSAGHGLCVHYDGRALFVQVRDGLDYASLEPPKTS